MSGHDDRVDTPEEPRTRELHEALDVVERHFLRDAKCCKSAGAHPLDLIAQIRRQIVTSSSRRRVSAR